MDTDNPVVKLCVEGMEAERQFDSDAACRIFMKAWNISTNDYELCMAAHYIARHQKTTEDTLHWNKVSLKHADAVNDDRVKGFYPSLYLNMGKSNEELGNYQDARKYYNLAGEQFKNLADDPYGAMVKDAVERGIKRIQDKTDLL